MCFLSSLTKLAHMPDLGRMAKLNVDTLSKKNYKKKTKGVANEQRMVSSLSVVSIPSSSAIREPILMKRFFREPVSSIRILLQDIMSF